MKELKRCASSTCLGLFLSNIINAWKFPSPFFIKTDGERENERERQREEHNEKVCGNVKEYAKDKTKKEDRVRLHPTSQAARLRLRRQRRCDCYNFLEL